MKEDPKMRPTAVKADVIFKRRLVTNFTNHLRMIHRFFRPDIDQEKDMTDAERAALREYLNSEEGRARLRDELRERAMQQERAQQPQSQGGIAPPPQ